MTLRIQKFEYILFQYEQGIGDPREQAQNEVRNDTAQLGFLIEDGYRDALKFLIFLWAIFVQTALFLPNKNRAFIRKFAIGFGQNWQAHGIFKCLRSVLKTGK